MADTTAATGLIPQQWDAEFFEEYIRESRFTRYKGTDENSLIQVKEDLTVKKGSRLTFALVNRLQGDGRQDNEALEGFEEELGSRSHALSVRPLRHAVKVTEWDEQKSAIDLRNAGRTMLKNWFMEKERDHIIRALRSINRVAYGDASEAQKDAWLVDNADRVLFGAAKSNNASNDHSASLSNIDNTADKLTPDTLRLMKRMAQTASPKIRPVKVKGDQEWFVVFAGTLPFRDFSTNSEVKQVNRDARPRDIELNPLFTGDSLILDGMIIREIPEIPVISGVGAGGIDVSQVLLCGAQAVGIGYARRFESTTQVSDYKFKNGVGGREIRGIEKLLFGTGEDDTDDLKDNGVATLYVASVADA